MSKPEVEDEIEKNGFIRGACSACSGLGFIRFSLESGLLAAPWLKKEGGE